MTDPRTPASSPMTVGMVGLWPPPLGGVATVCTELTRSLARRGHVVHFVDTAGAAAQPKTGTEHLGGFVPFTRVRLLDIGRALLGLVGARGGRRRVLLARALAEALRLPWFRTHPRQCLCAWARVDRMATRLSEAGVSLLVGHHAGVASWEGLMVARHYLHVPMWVVLYASEFTMEVNRPLLPLARTVCAGAAGLISISRYTRACAERAGVDHPRHPVVALGCDPRHLAPPDEAARRGVCARLGVVEGRPLVLYVGWLLARKGPQVLMEALIEAADRDDWQAIFVGPDGDLGASLRRQASEPPLRGRVRVLPPVSLDDLCALYDTAAVFVFPTLSRDEGFGLVGLEAMAHGLPVVASRTGAIPELVLDGQTGLLFDAGDARGLARHLRFLLDHEPERVRLGARGRERAVGFTWDRTAEQMLRAWQGEGPGA